MRPALVVLGMLCLAVGPAAAFELGELFSTPEQRAAARLEAGEHEVLIERAPDARWEGLGRYGAGDHAGAAEAFARALREREAGEGTLSARERDALLLDRATAETRAGRLAEALSLYDGILERDPSNEDARHNRDIARALQALDERDRERDEESGESGKPSDDGSGEEDGEGGDSYSSAAAVADADAADRDGSGRAREGEDPDEADGRVDEAEEAAAREALAAEGAEESEGDGQPGSMTGEARTPSEREQATEQWLRRIDDDPAGLLRRRLHQNHRDDYPEVRDSDEPW